MLTIQIQLTMTVLVPIEVEESVYERLLHALAAQGDGGPLFVEVAGREPKSGNTMTFHINVAHIVFVVRVDDPSAAAPRIQPATGNLNLKLH